MGRILDGRGGMPLGRGGRQIGLAIGGQNGGKMQEAVAAAGRMDRLDELRVLVAILDGGSLAAAGRRLRLSPPAVTRALAGMERRLGVRLLERTTRRAAPTEAGRRLGVQARGLLASYEEAIAEAVGEVAAPRGRLRVAAPLVFGRRHVAPLVAEFLDARPAVTAELQLSDRPVDLVEEGVDVALRIGHLPETALVARRVGGLRRMVLASPDYLARRGTPAVPADLEGHEVVLFSILGAAPDWRFARPQGGGEEELVVRVAPRFTVTGAEAAVEAACAGRGLVRALSYQVAEELADGRLVRLLRAFEPPPVPVHLVFPTARLMALRLRAFLDFAAPRLSSLPVLREG
jgi:DNA-binding transcriptional LysR family regulator